MYQVYTYIYTGAKAGWALFHISNRKNWEFLNPRDFRHAMDMKFSTFLHEFKELSTSSGNRDRMGFCPGISHASAAHANTRQIARGGRCLNNCTKGGKYALHSAVQNVSGQSFEWTKPQSSNSGGTSVCHGIYSYRYLHISCGETRQNSLLCRHNCHQCSTEKNTEPQKIVRCRQYCMLQGPIIK
jgi:hypothetical protein